MYTFAINETFNDHKEHKCGVSSKPFKEQQ